MAHRINPAPHDDTGPIFYWTTFVLACLGVLDAAYLLVYKLTNINAMCLGNGGCHDVNFSTYSEIGGVPVSVFGIVSFLAIAVLVLLEQRMKMVKENGPLVIFGISLGGMAFTAYLTWLEIYIIHAICPFCVASAVIITLIFILAAIRLVKQTTH